MPTILVQKPDLETAARAADRPRRGSPSELESAKAEVKGFDPATGELKIELNDTNRPDLWSPPGLARHLKIARTGQAPDYDFFAPLPARSAVPGGKGTSGAQREIHVDPQLRAVRPYVAGFLAFGAPLTDAGLRSLIQSQEKLAENYGQRRRAVAIGAYRAAADPLPDQLSGGESGDRPLCPARLRSLAHARRDSRRASEGTGVRPSPPRPAPAIRSSSMRRARCSRCRPMVNSQGLGAVAVGRQGPVRRGDRSGSAHAASRAQHRRRRSRRPRRAHRAGDRLLSLRHAFRARSADAARFRRAGGGRPAISSARLLGMALPDAEVADDLRRSGYRQVADRHRAGGRRSPSRRRRTGTTSCIPWTSSKTWRSPAATTRFDPILPEEFTVGRLSREEQLARRITDLLVGAGYQQVVSNILTARELIVERMGRASGEQRENGGNGEANLVEVANVMSANYAVLRDSIVPSLLGGRSGELEGALSASDVRGRRGRGHRPGADPRHPHAPPRRSAARAPRSHVLRAARRSRHAPLLPGARVCPRAHRASGVPSGPRGTDPGRRRATRAGSGSWRRHASSAGGSASRRAPSSSTSTSSSKPAPSPKLALLPPPARHFVTKLSFAWGAIRCHAFVGTHHHRRLPVTPRPLLRACRRHAARRPRPARSYLAFLHAVLPSSALRASPPSSIRPVHSRVPRMLRTR